MERAEFLTKMRAMAEALYDHFGYNRPEKWTTTVDEDHREYLAKFYARLGKGGVILSAACGSGRFDGLLAEAGYQVLGIDQSAGELECARERFPAAQYPQIRYEKLGMQEMGFEAEFDGLLCMDAMEHISPEDWPVIVKNFARALKPGGALYLTADQREEEELKRTYERARAMGLPVVYGEVADEVEVEYERAIRTGHAVDQCVYHFVPPVEQIEAWMARAGLDVVEVGRREEYIHILAVKRA